MPRRLRHSFLVVGRPVFRIRPTDSVCGQIESTCENPILHLLGLSDKLAFLTLSKKSPNISLWVIQSTVCPRTSSTNFELRLTFFSPFCYRWILHGITLNLNILYLCDMFSPSQSEIFRAMPQPLCSYACPSEV